MKINAYLKYRKSKDSYTSIYLNICYSGKRFKFYLNESVKPSDWDFKKQKHKSDIALNAKIENWQRDIHEEFKIFYNANKCYPLPATFQKVLQSNLRQIEKEPLQKEGFFDFFDRLIQRSEIGSRQPKKQLIRKSTIQIYKRVRQTVIDFKEYSGRKIDFLTLNNDFYDQYTTFLIKKNYTNNTIGKYLSVVKVVALEAQDSGFDIHPFIRSKKYVILRQKDIDNIYLTSDQIIELESLDLKLNPTLDKVRDLFVLQCHTGLRYSDILQLTTKSIQGGYLFIKKSVKTDNTIEIPISEPIQRIIKKNNGGFPIKMSNQKVNQYLKDLGQKIPSLTEKFSKDMIKGGKNFTVNKPKWQLLSTHTARRSYCTNAYLQGIPIQDIMAISGHKTEKSFRVYLKMKGSDHSKAANERISQNLKVVHLNTTKVKVNE